MRPNTANSATIIPDRTMKLIAKTLIFVALASPVLSRSQFIGHGLQQPQAATKPAAIAFTYPEQIVIPAGKPTAVALHFRIAPGLHINSHSPKDEFLIPTTFTVAEGRGLKVVSLHYPAGEDVALPIDPKNKLNVFMGEFILDAKLVADPGHHLVQSTLRYQACDQHECMPPRNIPIQLDVTGQ